MNEENIYSLRERIMALPVNTVVYRACFPDFHSEYVGKTLTDMANEGVLYKMAYGLYVKPKITRKGIELPPIETVVEAIAARDGVEILPSGEMVLQILGFSPRTEPVYDYVTTGSSRVVNIHGHDVQLRVASKKNFHYKTKFVAYLVQALQTIGKENLGEREMEIIRNLIAKEYRKPGVSMDMYRLPFWMRKLVKPIIASL